MFKYIVKRLAPHRAELLIAVISLCIFTFLGMLLPLLLRRLIDEVIPGQQSHILVVLLLGMVLIYAMREIFFYLSHYITYKMSQDILNELRKEVFSHLQKLTLRFYENMRTGILISSLINDIQKVQSMISLGIIQICCNGLQATFITIYLFYLNWQLAVCTLMVLPILGYSFYRSKNRLDISQKQSSELVSEVSANLSEVLNGVKVVKAIGSQQRETQRFYSLFDNMSTVTLDINKQGILLWIVVDSLAAFGIMLCLGVGTMFIWQGKMTLGGFVSFYAYVGMAFMPIVTLCNLAGIMSEGYAGMSRLMKLLEEQPDFQEGLQKLPNKTKGHIQFKNVSFSYEPGRYIFKDFNLEIKPGESVAFVGSSGCGKSTLASLLLRFYDTGSGTISLDGQNIRELTDDSFREHIGVVLQEPFLFSGTIAENISYGKQNVKREEIEQAARSANAHDFILQLPKQYETQIGERGVLLSGGQKQRLAIARTLLKAPSVLILDEATSALDNESEKEVQKAIDGLKNEQTTIMIAHRLSTIKNVDRIIVLEKGEIVEQGTHDLLMQLGGRYYDLYMLSLNTNKDEILAKAS